MNVRRLEPGLGYFIPRIADLKATILQESAIFFELLAPLWIPSRFLTRQRGRGGLLVTIFSRRTESDDEDRNDDANGGPEGFGKED